MKKLGLTSVLTSDTHLQKENEDEHHSFLNDIAGHYPDLISHAGDWISHDQSCLERTFFLFRHYFPKIPIVTSFGNHDLWLDRWIGKRSISDFTSMLEKHKELCAKYNITHLDTKTFVFKNIAFFGIDNWYDSLSPDTNDHKWLPLTMRGLPIHTYLNAKARQDFDAVLKEVEKDEYKDKKKFFVSHFPTWTPNYQNDGFIAPTSWHSFVIEHFDYAHYGHTHLRVENELHGRCRINNSGSYYRTDANPSLKFIVLKVPNEKQEVSPKDSQE